MNPERDPRQEREVMEHPQTVLEDAMELAGFPAPSRDYYRNRMGIALMGEALETALILGGEEPDQPQTVRDSTPFFPGRHYARRRSLAPPGALDAMFEAIGVIGAALGFAGAVWFAVSPHDWMSWLVLVGVGAAMLGASLWHDEERR